ncbi:Mismatch repair protein msh3 [Plenodomus lingam]|uniref:MutS protein homolog 3 n=1 Tax=Leptosphaeria maculans (strain JN3 / isolate v23.1.3 / race Av1-4-5-6-7-8) TaxID=985895 RepID=E4ZZI1_LEPMJ|nr:similar to DNA mismatch repair protein msh3 [Plenodomus lingam JN3]KAH9867368.1 Mismatch repair protein msh3 [Plenodomus lingam]CBX97097.1 similar to DNA mismatch repair protein msh3 [Plenodomus lingam JN3]
MAPKNSQSLLSSSQKGKQQTISSFFAPKSSQTPKPAPTPNSTTKPVDKPVAPIEPDSTKPPSDDDEDEDEGLPLSRPLPTRKRAVVIHDEDDDSGRSSPSKRVRLASEDSPRQTLGQTSTTDLNIPKPPKITDRTAKFLFSSSQPAQDENGGEEATAASQKQRQKLHEKFVKKLGRPDSFAELRRRNKITADENVNAEEGEADEDEDEEPAPKPVKGKKGAATKKTTKLTPMEMQYLEIKRKHLDTVIVMEVGYKYKFFGEDARTASKELGIVCIPGKFRYDEHPSEAHLDRFASASFPTHRLQVHVKRLVQANHKVGVVRQIETAALKAAGNNRNAPFVRKLTNLYTKGTYVDDVEGLETSTAGAGAGAQSTGYLLCITETNAKGWGSDEKVHVGLVAVQPATGDIIYDDFEDGFMRSEIETRMLHIAPAEFLVVGDLSKATDKLIQHLSASKTNVFGDRSRVERVEKPKTMAAQAYSHISNFYAGKMKSSQGGDSESDQQGAILDKVHQLSEHVTICLSAMITYLTDYGLEHVFDLTKYFQPFSARSYMLLNGNTLSSLEIYQNATDYTAKGSLFWTMDRTKTRFGQRLLRKWIGRPLIDKARLEERIAAVEELKEGENTIPVDKLKFLLGRIKTDLEKVLIRIYYKKCSRPELLAALQTLQDLSSQYLSSKTPEKSGFKSILLSEAVSNVPKIYEDVNSFLDQINAKAAKEDDKYSFFREEHEAEDINDFKLSIASVEDDLNSHKKDAGAKLGKSKIDYVTVAGIEYLIEVKRKSTEEKKVPASWQQISATKSTLRFHTPEVKRMLQERDQYKESLAAACDAAFIRLLEAISSKYQQLRDCVSSLATLDALLSLATLASQPGYVKPTFTDNVQIDITGGRHPMVEQILLDSYVPNDLHLSHDHTRSLLITGPNMGGKSSYVRSAALIAIMGQIGSYVPATQAKLGMLDAVFTRMGAFDNMLQGESTFMVELSETADILKSATPRSLVILDELGRGTSTFDGVAIAEAVLDHVVCDLKSLTLFITHYQHLAKLEKRFPGGQLKNVHMRFEERAGGKEVVFLYEAAEGTSHRSYGLNVARLARVPEKVIAVAEVKSRELEESMEACRMGNLARMMKGLLMEGGDEESLEKLVEGIDQL